MSTDLARVFLDYNRCVRIASGSSVTLCPHGIDVGLLEKVCPLGCWCVSPRMLVCVPSDAGVCPRGCGCEALEGEEGSIFGVLIG